MQAYAGPFRRLEAVGSTYGPGVGIHTRHRFTADYVQTSWRVLPVGPERSGHDVRVLFPSTGSDVTVTAGLRDGRELSLTGASRLALDEVAWFHLGGASCGYVVVLRTSRLPGHAHLTHPARQSSAPHAGPTLVLEPIHNGRLRDLTVSARIAPARTLEDARQLAGRLGARPSFLRTAASDVPR